MPETVKWLNVGRNRQFLFSGQAGREVYDINIPDGEIWEVYAIEAQNRTRQTGFCAFFLRDGDFSAGEHVILKAGNMTVYGSGCIFTWDGRERARNYISAEISNVTALDDIRVRINARRGQIDA